jgi:hypothetical protein
MSNVGTSGKFGTSMDTSQLTELRRKYRTIQMQNSKKRVVTTSGASVPSTTTVLVEAGDQSVKPKFNSNRVIGGDSQNGSSEYYNQKGLVLMYSRPGLMTIS